MAYLVYLVLMLQLSSSDLLGFAPIADDVWTHYFVCVLSVQSQMIVQGTLNPVYLFLFYVSSRFVVCTLRSQELLLVSGVPPLAHPSLSPAFRAMGLGLPLKPSKASIAA